MESLDTLRAAPHLIVSALKLWVSCPRKYRFRYVDKARPSHRAIALVFGHAWHALVGYVLMLHQKGHSAGGAELREYLATALRSEMEQDGPPVLFDDEEDLDSLIATGMGMLDAFLANVPQPRRVLRVEQPFRHTLVDPQTREPIPLPLIGAIDAVVENDDYIELWELKSGKRRWAADAVSFDFQPTAYSMAMRAMLRKGRCNRNVRLKLIVTTKAKNCDVQVEDLVRTAADERDLEETAASIVRAIGAGCFHPNRTWMCGQCEYAEVCR